MTGTVNEMHPRTERKQAAARRVRDLLRSAIVNGELDRGSLPGESALMLMFSASRQVVRDALDLLRHEGLVRRLPGVGTLSSSSRLQHDFNFLHGPHPAGIDHRIVTAVIEQAPPQVRRKLALEGDEVGVVELVTLLAGEPLDAATAYVRPEFLPRATSLHPQGEWFALYEQVGISIGTTEQSIGASVADHVLAGRLGVEVGHPILVFERLVYDQDRKPLEYVFTSVRGDRVTLRQSLVRTTG